MYVGIFKINFLFALLEDLVLIWYWHMLYFVLDEHAVWNELYRHVYSCTAYSTWECCYIRLVSVKFKKTTGMWAVLYMLAWVFLHYLNMKLPVLHDAEEVLALFCRNCYLDKDKHYKCNFNCGSDQLEYDLQQIEFQFCEIQQMMFKNFQLY